MRKGKEILTSNFEIRKALDRESNGHRGNIKMNLQEMFSESSQKRDQSRALMTVLLGVQHFKLFSGSLGRTEVLLNKEQSIACLTMIIKLKIL
jgi:hypothetical protein